MCNWEICHGSFKIPVNIDVKSAWSYSAMITLEPRAFLSDVLKKLQHWLVCLIENEKPMAKSTPIRILAGSGISVSNGSSSHQPICHPSETTEAFILFTIAGLGAAANLLLMVLVLLKKPLKRYRQRSVCQIEQMLDCFQFSKCFSFLFSLCHKLFLSTSHFHFLHGVYC